MVRLLFSWPRIEVLIAVVGAAVRSCGLNNMSAAVCLYTFLHFIAHATQTTIILFVGRLLKFKYVCGGVRVPMNQQDSKILCLLFSFC